MTALAAAGSADAPGALGFLVVFGMAVILFFVFRSMARHLRKVSGGGLPGASVPGAGASEAGQAGAGDAAGPGAAAQDGSGGPMAGHGPPRGRGGDPGPGR